MTPIARLLDLLPWTDGDDPVRTDGGDAPFVCRGCGATYQVQHHVCPACDGFSVERRHEQ